MGWCSCWQERAGRYGHECQSEDQHDELPAIQLVCFDEIKHRPQQEKGHTGGDAYQRANECRQSVPSLQMPIQFSLRFQPIAAAQK